MQILGFLLLTCRSIYTGLLSFVRYFDDFASKLKYAFI